MVSAPAARATIWWPRQMPSSGRPSSMTSRASATGPVEPGRVAGSRREHDAAHVGREHVARRRRVRQHPDPDAAPAQRVDDVRLEPVVDDRDERLVRARRPPRGPPTARPGRRSPGPPSAARRGPASTAAAWSVTPGSVITPRRQPFARRWRARARVSTPAIAGMPCAAQQRRELARVVEDRGRRVGHDEARGATGARDWSSSRQPAVVADQRVGHHDDLARVRGIGGDLLVAGLRGVDDEVAARGRRGRRTRCPGKTVPSSSARSAGPASPTRGSTIASARGSGGCGTVGGAITGSRRAAAGVAAGRGATAPRAGMRTSIWPPTRPLRTGRPASQDRRSGCPER